MLRSKKMYLFLGSFLIPSLVLIILWNTLHLAPFGDNNLLVSDLGTQYLPFLSAFKHFVQGDSSSLYSFSDALGGNTLSLCAYYLLSPFNFLVLLFSYQQLPIAILLIITLKISLMGTTVFYYLEKTYSKISIGTLLFSTAYSLCGFVTVYFLNFMWLDALILLPLLVLGIQFLWDKQKYGLYCVTLFLSIVTNYYMGYMLCLFAVCYSLYWYIRTNPSLQKNRLLSFLKNSRLFFLTSFLTGLSTSFVLLPAAEGMLATKKTSFDFFSFLPIPKFGLDFFSQFSLGSINFDLRLSHLPTIFSGTLILLLVFFYFQLKSITKYEKIYAACLLGILFLSFWVELLNTAWHMFQSPAGFPYRNTFIFSFLLIKFAYEAYLKLKEEKKFIWLAPIHLSSLLLIGIISLVLFGENDYLLSSYYGIITLLLIWIYSGLLYLNHRGYFKKQGVYSFFLLFIVSTELLFNFWISTYEIPFGDQQAFTQTYTTQKEALSAISTKDPTLYRIKQTVNATDAGYREIHNGYNNPMLYNYAGVSSYTSTLDAATQDTLTALGLYQKNDRRIAYVDGSKVINFLLNVRYLVTDGSKNIQENSEAVGIGFLVPDSFGAVSLSENNPLTNQENILQSISPSGETYFQSVTNEKVVRENNALSTLTAETTADGEVYLYIPSIHWENVESFTVNGKSVQPSISIVTNQLFCLGNFAKGTPLQLEIHSKKEIDITSADLRTLKQETFDSMVEKQKDQSIELVEAKDGTLTGSIQTENDTDLLYLAIPFDKKWSILVDGKSVTPKKVMGNFIGLSLPKGSHTITMHYRQTTLLIGCIISAAVLFFVFIYHLFHYRRNLSNPND